MLNLKIVFLSFTHTAKSFAEDYLYPFAAGGLLIMSIQVSEEKLNPHCEGFTALGYIELLSGSL